MIRDFFRRSDISSVFGALAIACSFSMNALAADVNINANTHYQTIRGFGGMSGVGWIADLTNDQVDKAYGNGDGQIGMSIMRMRIDPNSSAWNRQIPAAKRAVSKYGAIVLATPWTPPAYMKSNNSPINGGKLLTRYYSAYTDHLLSFADYMKSNGVPIYAMSLQNEPDWHPDYESADWSGADFTNFLLSQGNRFGSLKVLAPESLGFNHAYSDPLLNNASSAQHVDIIGGHLYGSTPKDYPLARSKGKEIWMTEHITNTEAANDWSKAIPLATELHQSMASNFNAYIWWYIRRSYGLLTEDGNVSKRGYIMAQYSKYVRPGYVRIGATEKPQSGVSVTAYKGPDNKYVIVAVNTSSSHQNLNLKLQNASAASLVKYSTSSSLNLSYGGTYTLSNNATSVWVEPQSIATFVSDGSGSGGDNGGSSSNDIVVRMQGISGDESVNLTVGGTTVGTWTLNTNMTDYSVTTDLTGEIRVAFTNDATGRDVQVDYIVVNGVVRQAEDQADNTGVWGNSSCGGGSYSEWLHCNGSIGFGGVDGITGGGSSSGNDGDTGGNTGGDTSGDDQNADGISAVMNINNEWDGGYCADLVITNESGSAMTWSVDIPVEGTVNSLWNGDWSQQGDVLHVAGLDWGTALEAGESLTSIGFCADR
ncbi:cellulose binding domain-containing protein [Gynuella sp.]|uniref:cellulose binding domain-containing protein n=1 Tax=Gynuella sp. TaxID=2969146 RepID=UPI003D14209A